MRAHPDPNRSGKIQRPGPDSPGGPRVKRKCEICLREFWPRKVDVDAGKGKHCSSNCSSKALRRTKIGKCQRCGCEVGGQRPGAPPKYCEKCRPIAAEERAAKLRKPRAPRKDNRARIELAGEWFTYAELAKASGKSVAAVSQAAQMARATGKDPARAILGEKNREAMGNRHGPGGRKLTHDGVTLNVNQWAKRLGISGAAMARRLRRWPVARALSQLPQTQQTKEPKH